MCFRITGSFENPAGFAAIQSLLFIVPLYCSFKNRINLYVRIVASSVAILAFVAVVLSGSRCGVLAISGQSRKSTCNVGGFRHDAIIRNYTGGYSFDFDFEVYAHYVKYIEYPFNPINMTIVGFVNGTYDNGIKYVWSMASDYNLIISFPDLN